MKLLITILFLVPVTLCEVDNYIVGGDIIEIDQVPYLVGIYLYGLIFSCGGSLISKNYVLTAGHCINSMFTYKVRIGSDDKYEGGVMIDVVNSTRHPKYKNLDYDYGLMELKEGEKLPDVVKFIQLANENDVTKDGEQMFIAGWGETNSNETDGYLRGALVPFLSNEKCEKSYGKNFTDRMVCAGYEEGGIDTCQGDSGGSLVRIRDGILVGITSWGYGCAEKGYPGVYAKVSAVRSWIREISSV